jgi:hypothetical protein
MIPLIEFMTRMHLRRSLTSHKQVLQLVDFETKETLIRVDVQDGRGIIELIRHICVTSHQCRFATPT